MERMLLRLGELSLRAPRCSCGAVRSFSQTTAARGASKTERIHKDPYAIAQARARKAAHVSRHAEVVRQREEALGDPIRGLTTPFVETFATAARPAPDVMRSSAVATVQSESHEVKSAPEHKGRELNYLITEKELQSSLDRSLVWSGTRFDLDDVYGSEEQEETMVQADEKSPTHLVASEAIRRITSLANASSKDRLRVNIRHCITAFGRHNTDQHLPGKPAASASFIEMMRARNKGQPPAEKTPRAGPDVGSSEVQVAILTARIRTLADALGTRGRKDKHNKRNLRLLVHRRQKLLKYLRRKERGGPRFENLVDVLGLQPAAWEGEITLR